MVVAVAVDEEAGAVVEAEVEEAVVAFERHAI